MRSLPKIPGKTISYALRMVSGQLGEVDGLKHMKSFVVRMAVRVASRKNGNNYMHGTGFRKREGVKEDAEQLRKGIVYWLDNFTQPDDQLGLIQTLHSNSPKYRLVVRQQQLLG